MLDCIDNWERARAAVAAGDSGPHTIVPGDLLADIEDGAALRRLREALPDGDHYIAVDSPIDDMGWDVSVESIYPSHPLVHVIDPRLAAAADKAREAIETDR